MKKETKLQELERRIRALENRYSNINWSPIVKGQEPKCICDHWKDSTGGMWFCPVHGMQIRGNNNSYPCGSQN